MDRNKVPFTSRQLPAALYNGQPARPLSFGQDHISPMMRPLGPTLVTPRNVAHEPIDYFSPELHIKGSACTPNQAPKIKFEPMNPTTLNSIPVSYLQPEMENKWAKFKKDYLVNTLKEDPTKLARVRNRLENGESTTQLDRMLFDKKTVMKLTGWTHLQWAEDGIGSMHEFLGPMLEKYQKAQDTTEGQPNHARRRAAGRYSRRASRLAARETINKNPAPKPRPSTSQNQNKVQKLAPAAKKPFRRHHDVVYGCKFCGHVDYAKSLKAHIQIGCPGLTCICGEVRKSKVSFETHRQFCDVPYECGTCGQLFQDKQLLYLHTTAARHQIVEAPGYYAGKYWECAGVTIL